MKSYFLSYSRHDQAFALRFANDLKAGGVDVWVDQFNIAIGQNWDREVEAAVRKCDGFIVVLSTHSVSSENVADEVAVAIDGAKHIIPILHEKCTLPMRLSRVQFIDATANYADALQRCVNLIVGKHADEGVALSCAIDEVAGAGRARADAGGPAPAAANSMPPEAIDNLCNILTVYLGPIARHVLIREMREAASREDLYQRLGARIPDDKERAGLLKKLRAS